MTNNQDRWTGEIKYGHCRVCLGKRSEVQNVSKLCGRVALRLAHVLMPHVIACLGEHGLISPAHPD